MTEIKLVHGRSTTVQEPPAKSEMIGGGLFHHAAEFGKVVLPKRYEIVSTAEMTQLLDRAGSVLGGSEEDILVQLKQQYPCPEPLATYLHRADFKYDPGTGVDGGRRRRYYSSRDDVRFDGWLVMDQMVTECTNIATLQDLTRRVGAVLMPEAAYEQLGTPESLKAMGFVSVPRRFELWQVNYNPRRTSRYNYEAALKVYKHRTTNEFPGEAIHAIYWLMHRASAVESWRLLFIEKDESANKCDVVELDRTLRQLCPKYFKAGDWRDKYYKYAIHNRRSKCVDSLTFKQAIEACLPVLHIEEERARNEKIADDVDELLPCGKIDLRFCRIIRREAKALKLKIPKKPVPPKPPRAKRRHGKQRRKK